MENNQSIGNIMNSILKDVNVNSQIESTLNLIESQSSKIDSLENKLENEITTLRNEKIQIENKLNKIESRINRDGGLDIIVNKLLRRKNIFFWIAGASFLLSIIAICGAFIYKDTVIVKESIVLIFVGTLATFVVIGNYLQTYLIQKDFYKSLEVIKTDLIKLFDLKVTDSRFFSEATTLLYEGKRRKDKGEYTESLRLFIRSLNFLNNLSEKMDVENVISNIQWLLITHQPEIKLGSESERDAIIKTIENSNHSLVNSLKIIINELKIN